MASAVTVGKGLPGALLTVLLTTACGGAERPAAGELYVSRTGLFEVVVPEMRNPFVPTPSVSERAPSGAEAAVLFSVADLGEAWMFGVRPPEGHGAGMDLADLADAELARWRRDGPGGRGTPRADSVPPTVLLEDSVLVGDLAGLARVYRVDGSSMMGRPWVLVEVATARAPEGRVVFAVAQFEMQLDMWDFFIDDVGRRPERVLEIWSQTPAFAEAGERVDRHGDQDEACHQNHTPPRRDPVGPRRGLSSVRAPRRC